MGNEKSPAPLQFKGVMVSSTFTDLKDHRAALIRAIKGQRLTDISMENDTAKPDLNVIDSSLQMVRDSSAYIGLISHRYGQTPKCPRRNPDELSITELEFDEAQRLNRPILLFIMGEQHSVTKADIETDPAKITKLNAFRENAKKMSPGSEVQRVYATFDSLEEFKEKAIHAIANLRRFLDSQDAAHTHEWKEPERSKADPIIAQASEERPSVKTSDEAGLHRALEMARRALSILEEQSAGYGQLHIPAHLQIELEEKRREVAELEKRLKF
jgi:hypothetical protein